MPSDDEITAILTSAALLERLAAVEHERWSHWQRYVHAQCEVAEDGSLVIPAALVQRWATQLATPYADLAPSEQESDREQVQRYLPVIAEALAPGAF